MKPFKVSRKPNRCIRCGKPAVVKILYGEPTDESWELAQNGKLVIGGCVVNEKSPKWECTQCETQYIKIKN